MKTSRTSGKKTVASEKPEGAVKKTRRRQSGVRGRVLSLLASGPHTSASLVAKGGFSAASLYLNLKTLKKEGLVQTVRNGRVVWINLKAAKGAAAPAKPAPIEGEVVAPAAAPSGGALVSAYVPRDLHEALDALTRKLSPIDRASEKLLVLDQLSRTLAAPVASVLREIMDDVVRYSSDAVA